LFSYIKMASPVEKKKYIGKSIGSKARGKFPAGWSMETREYMANPSKNINWPPKLDRCYETSIECAGKGKEFRVSCSCDDKRKASDKQTSYRNEVKERGYFHAGYKKKYGHAPPGVGAFMSKDYREYVRNYDPSEKAELIERGMIMKGDKVHSRSVSRASSRSSSRSKSPHKTEAESEVEAETEAVVEEEHEHRAKSPSPSKQERELEKKRKAEEESKQKEREEMIELAKAEAEREEARKIARAEAEREEAKAKAEADREEARKIARAEAEREEAKAEAKAEAEREEARAESERKSMAKEEQEERKVEIDRVPLPPPPLPHLVPLPEKKHFFILSDD
jgi:hypothetical protein